MNLKFLKRRKFWKRLVTWTIAVPVVLLLILTSVVYYKQDAIVQEMLVSANKDFEGKITIGGSHIAPFANFPYISIDLEDLEIYESKRESKAGRLVHIADAYIGFNIWDVLSGKMTVKSVKLSNGDLKIVQHKDGSFNIVNAFASKKPAEAVEEDLHLDLKSISLTNIDISKLNEENNLLVDAYIDEAQSNLLTSTKELKIGLDAKFQLSLIKNGDTTFIKHKHFGVATDLHIDNKTQLLTIDPTEILLEKSTFNFDGTVDLKNDADIDLHFRGNKPNFDLFMAMAPEELNPTLEKLDNKGSIFFSASVKGKSMNGHSPAINASFGCSNGIFSNTETGKKLHNINFSGTFTNGAKRDMTTMLFEMENFSAKPEAGIFSGKIRVENFEAPDIDMKLRSDFNLDFLSRFFNIHELNGLSGRVALKMNFHDIIDIAHPEKSIEKLNESYFTELLVDNLKFTNKSYDVPLNDLDIRATLKGHKAVIQHFNIVQETQTFSSTEV